MFPNCESCISMLAEIDHASFGSLIQLVIMIICTLGWLFFTPAINNDAIELSSPKRVMYNTVYLFAGFIALLAWIFIPIFWIGLPVFILFVAGAGYAYVAHRNTLVDPEYRVGISGIGKLFSIKKAPKGPELDTKIRLYSHDGRPFIVTDDKTSDSKFVKGYNAAQAMLFQAVLYRAAEIMVAANQNGAHLRFIIDGVLKDQSPGTIEETNAMMQFIKQVACDTDKPEPQNKGKISVDLANSPIEMEVLFAFSPKGNQIKIRVLDELIQTDLTNSGMEEPMQNKLHDILEQPGIVIVTGAKKTGVTSTGYSLIRKQDAFMRLLTTVEKSPEADLDNINQYAYETDDNLEQILTQTIRRDPDLILIDNCPNKKVAQTLCEFAREKTVVLEIPAADTFNALVKWIKLVGSLADAVAPVRAVTNQILIRKLCEACKESYTADPRMLQKLRLTPEQAAGFMRPRKEKPRDKDNKIIPCEICQDVEYAGRTGVFEMLEMTDALRQTISAGANLAQLKKAAKQEGMKSVQQNAINKITSGVTSVQEIIRISQQKAANK